MTEHFEIVSCRACGGREGMHLRDDSGLIRDVVCRACGTSAVDAGEAAADRRTATSGLEACVRRLVDATAAGNGQDELDRAFRALRIYGMAHGLTPVLPEGRWALSSPPKRRPSGSSGTSGIISR